MRNLKQYIAVLAAVIILILQLPVSAQVHNPGMTICYDDAEHWYTGSIFDLYVNGEKIEAAVDPIIFNDHAVVPLREVFEACGAEVNYDNDKKCVEVQYQYTYIRLYINDNTAYINGKRNLIPDGIVPKLIYKPGGETKTMVPVRFISESVGIRVDFDDEEGCIFVNTGARITSVPTEAPTETVTEAPTEAPTEIPTTVPADAPTAKPADAPAAEEENAAPTKAPLPANIKDSQGRMPTMKGIDVSEHQGVIDWESLKDDIDFAIIRCGYGSDYESQDDKMWLTNAEACEKLGIPYGVYLYSYANTPEKAESEAQHVIRLLKGRKVSLPVFYDMEDSIQEVLTNEERGQYAKLFCDAVSAAGYEVGIYANTYWWTNYLTDPVFENESWYRWVAQYADSCTYTGNYIMWQYSSSGSLGNITDHLDMNLWYGDVITAGK
ncbi:MAG: stalk domain-containing protein [Candidatus Ornithomonoglobus sp.]